MLRNAGVCLAACLLFISCQSSRSLPGRPVPSGSAAGAVTVDGSDRMARVFPKLLATVPPGTCREYRVIRSAVPNASMNTRGTLTVSTGLLRFAETDDLLAFAVAHELAHAVLQHPARLRRATWLQVIATAAVAWAAQEVSHSKCDAALAGGGFFLSSALLGTLPLRRRMEKEADLMARDLLHRAGYAPQAAARFWECYADARPRRPRPAWLSAHPSDTDRVRYLVP